MELFAADGHDAGGCERVTGKSGMRPSSVCRRAGRPLRRRDQPGSDPGALQRRFSTPGRRGSRFGVVSGRGRAGFLHCPSRLAGRSLRLALGACGSCRGRAHRRLGIAGPFPGPATFLAGCTARGAIRGAPVLSGSGASGPRLAGCLLRRAECRHRHGRELRSWSRGTGRQGALGLGPRAAPYRRHGGSVARAHADRARYGRQAGCCRSSCPRSRAHPGAGARRWRRRLAASPSVSRSGIRSPGYAASACPAASVPGLSPRR